MPVLPSHSSCYCRCDALSQGLRSPQALGKVLFDQSYQPQTGNALKVMWICLVMSNQLPARDKSRRISSLSTGPACSWLSSSRKGAYKRETREDIQAWLFFLSHQVKCRFTLPRRNYSLTSLGLGGSLDENFGYGPSRVLAF